MESTNQKQLAQISYNTSQINTSAITYASALLNNSITQKLMLGQNFETQEIVRTYQLLDYSIKGTPFVYSMYVYNGKSDTYYAIGPYSVIREGSLWDNGIDDILNSSDYIPTGPVPRRFLVDEFTGKEYINVFTYILSERFISSDEIKGALIVNVKADWIFDSISYNQLQSNETSEIIILDENNHVVGHSDPTLFLSDLSQESYVKEIDESGLESGSLATIIGGKKSLVTYTHMKGTNWKLLNITAYSNITSAFNRVRNSVMLLAIATVLVGAIISYLVANKLYSPINLLTDRIQSIAGKDMNDKKEINEFDFFIDTFNNTYNRMNSLQIFKKNNLASIKKDFLYKALKYKTGSANYFFKKCEEFDMALSEGHSTQLCLFKIDKYLNFYTAATDSDRFIIRATFKNIIHSNLSRNYKCETIDLGEEYFASILQFEEDFEKEPQHYTNIKSIIKNIQSNTAEVLELSVSTFLSEISHNICDLTELYHSTLEMADYKIKFGPNCLMTQDDFTSLKFTELKISEINKQTNELLEEIKASNMERAEKHWAKIMELMKNMQFSDISFSLTYITSSVFNTLLMLENNSSIKFDIDYLEFNNKLKMLETFEDIHNHFTRLFTDITGKITKHKQGRLQTSVSLAIDYIENNYMDYNLSLNTIADYVNLSSTYLGRMFREFTLSSVSDYIKDVRLNKSRELLLDTNKSIVTILEEIGWSNVKYFYTVFKSKFGVTATEYRQKNKDLAK